MALVAWVAYFQLTWGFRGMYIPPARWAKSQDRIAQRPAMARWNRFAESIYKLKILWGLMLLRGARPFKVKLYLICFNYKFFYFKPIIYILILIVLNLGQVDLGTSECDKALHHASASSSTRLAGRVIEHALFSVTIDDLMKCSQGFRANGSDQEKIGRREGVKPSRNTLRRDRGLEH